MNKDSEAACFSYSEKQAAFLRSEKGRKNFREILKSESPNGISQWEQVKGIETTPNRSAALCCILTTEYTGAKDFISDDSPKVGTPRPFLKWRASENSRPKTRIATETATTVRMIMILPYGAGGEPGRGEIPMIRCSTP